MVEEKKHKDKKCITMDAEIFLELKLYAARKGVAYSVVIERLVGTYLKDPGLFNIDFGR